jgi:hypothetical protein
MILEATLRDVSFIAANLNADDEAECFGVLPSGTTSLEMAQMVMAASSLKWVAYYKQQPVMAFGASQDWHRDWAWSAWMFGTKDAPKAVPKVTRHIRGVLIPSLMEAGATRVEAISHAGHVRAHSWLSSLGANEALILRGYGRDNQNYVMFEWVRQDGQ